MISRYTSCADVYCLNDAAPTEIYTYIHTLSPPDALPLYPGKPTPPHRPACSDGPTRCNADHRDAAQSSSTWLSWTSCCPAGNTTRPTPERRPARALTG